MACAPIAGRPPLPGDFSPSRSKPINRQQTGLMMKRLLLGLAFAATLSLPALAADERNITIVNETGYEISFIGVNPPGDNDFDENEISTGLAHGQSVYVKF